MMKLFMLAAALSLSLSGAAYAAGKSDSSNASSCGTAHAAQADVNGNFGFLGQEYQGAPNYHGGVMGQEPGATGYNNSHTNCQTNPS
jgi:opacity protein-like surface antigen